MTILEYILLFLLVFGLLPALVLSYIIFSVLLVRTTPEKWGHSCSQPSDPEIVEMFGAGLAWRETYDANQRTAYITHDGLKLYGEFFDFGSDTTIIILPGRMECCIYACYFAEPYRKAGYNVLVVDGRAHGLSEGKLNYVGYRESGDILAWGEWLHKETRTRNIILHGICIGACTSLLAITHKDCPDYFRGVMVEGMFKTFYQSTKNHMQKDKRPLFPFLYLVMFYITIIHRINVLTDGPYKRIRTLNRPILFLHGRKDAFSLPHLAQEMYDSCPAPKELVWFDKGTHSRLRINNVEAYDKATLDFVTKVTASVPV